MQQIFLGGIRTRAEGSSRAYHFLIEKSIKTTRIRGLVIPLKLVDKFKCEGFF